MYQNCNKKGAKKEQFLHTGPDIESMYKIVTILVQKSNKKVPFLIQQAQLSKSVQFCNKKGAKKEQFLHTESDLESVYKIVTILVQKSNKKIPFLLQQVRV